MLTKRSFLKSPRPRAAPAWAVPAAAGELAQERIAECMRERGFVVGQDAQGRATSFEIPPVPDGDAQLLEALAECQEVQVLPAPVPASGEELSGLYGLELEGSNACLSRAKSRPRSQGAQLATP